MLTLPAALVSKKNDLEQADPWIVLLEAHLNDPDETDLYLARNNDNVKWNSQVFERFPFDLDISSQHSDGTLTKLSLTVSNILRFLSGALNEANGACGSTVIIRVINASSASDSTDCLIEEVFTVESSYVDDENVVFELGPDNFWGFPFPKNCYHRSGCMHQFKGTNCAYAGAGTTCNRTLGACIDFSNEDRYGAFPAIPGSAIDPEDAVTIEASA